MKHEPSVKVNGDSSLLDLFHMPNLQRETSSVWPAIDWQTLRLWPSPRASIQTR